MSRPSALSSPIRHTTERIVCGWIAEGIPIGVVAYACDLSVAALRSWLTSSVKRRALYRAACERRYPDLVQEVQALADEVEARRTEPIPVDILLRRAA